MSEPLQFFVRGHPKAQGSKKHVGHGVMVEMSKDLGPWRRAIAEEASKACNGRKLAGPVKVRACFWFQRPNSHYGTGRNAGQVKRSAPDYREANPDLDKLLRALFDALVIGGVVPDDRWIVEVGAEKRYGDPGVLIAIEEL